MYTGVFSLVQKFLEKLWNVRKVVNELLSVHRNIEFVFVQQIGLMIDPGVSLVWADSTNSDVGFLKLLYEVKKQQCHQRDNIIAAKLVSIPTSEEECQAIHIFVDAP